MAISLATALALAPTTLASFSAPVRVGFAGGDDWEPATAADAYGHVDRDSPEADTMAQPTGTSPLAAAASACSSAQRIPCSSSRTSISSRLARPGRFELPTLGSVDQCSIQLSYGRIPAKGRGEKARNILGRPVVSTTTLGNVRINGRIDDRWRAIAGRARRRKTRANYEKNAGLHANDDPTATPGGRSVPCGEFQYPEITQFTKVARLLLRGGHCQRPPPFRFSLLSLLGRPAGRRHDSLGCLTCWRNYPRSWNSPFREWLRISSESLQLTSYFPLAFQAFLDSGSKRSSLFVALPR